MIKVILTVIGTILWFIGPIFARITRSKRPGYFYSYSSHSFPGVAKDVIKFKYTDIIQILGVAFIVCGIIINYYEIPFSIIFSAFIIIPLWLIRTGFYYCKWAKPDNPDIKNTNNKKIIFRIIFHLKTLHLFFFCNMNITKLAEIKSIKK